MFRFFQLAAIFKRSENIRVLWVPLEQSLQTRLLQDWENQYIAFTNGIEEIAFDAGYTPGKSERFSLADYEPPEELIGVSTSTMSNLEQLHQTRSNASLNTISGLAGFAQDDQGVELVMFQNFTASRVIRPGRTLFLSDSTYTSIESPGLNLDGRLSAVYQPSENKLLFSNFRTVNTFLPLMDIYRDASAQEIREVLGHSMFAPEDIDALAMNANQWFQKHFALLRDSDIMDDYDINHLANRSQIYDVQLQLQGGRIVFPAERSAAKKLLQFLCEELYRGGITDTLYETNSKRVAG